MNDNNNEKQDNIMIENLIEELSVMSDVDNLSVMSDVAAASDLDVSSGDTIFEESQLYTPPKILAGYLVTRDEKYELYNGSNIIGRSVSADVTLDDETNYLAGEHAVIHISGMDWHLKHLSFHTTTEISSEKLKVGDWYKLPETSTILFGRVPAMICTERIAHLVLPTAASNLRFLRQKFTPKSEVKQDLV